MMNDIYSKFLVNINDFCKTREKKEFLLDNTEWQLK